MARIRAVDVAVRILGPFLFRPPDAIGYRGWIGCGYKPRTTTVDGLGCHAALTLDT